MNEILQRIIAAAIPVICLIITAGGAYAAMLLRRRTEMLKAEIDGNLDDKYIDMATEAVIQAVTYVAQTFADELKKDGAFNKDKQREAFYIAKSKVIEILGNTAVQTLNEIYGDFDVWLDTKIEEICREIKGKYSRLPSTETDAGRDKK